MWGTFKCTHIFIMGVTEKKRVRVRKKMFEEIMANNFLNLVKNNDIHTIHESIIVCP